MKYYDIKYSLPDYGLMTFRGCPENHIERNIEVIKSHSGKILEIKNSEYNDLITKFTELL